LGTGTLFSAAVADTSGTTNDPADFLGFLPMDEDGDGHVSKQEYMAHILDHLGPSENDPKGLRVAMLDFLSRLFDASDISGDEFLEESEVYYAQFLVHLARSCGSEEDCDDKMNFGAEKAATELETFDTDGDGSVSRLEFGHVVADIVSGCGRDPDGHPMDHLADMADSSYRAADKAHDGLLDRRELHFATLMVKERLIADRILLVFENIDWNGDQRIDENERAAAEAQYMSRADMRDGIPGLLVEGLAEADTNGDGVLEGDEIQELVNKIHIIAFDGC